MAIMSMDVVGMFVGIKGTIKIWGIGDWVNNDFLTRKIGKQSIIICLLSFYSICSNGHEIPMQCYSGLKVST
jgi:hypothetical protein